MTKLLILGFDGMDYFMAKETATKYPFKHLKPILNKQITKYSATGPSWASFYTGVGREVHGVIDFWGRNIGTSNSFRDIQDHVFWNIIKKAGYKICVDNLPITPDGFPYTSDKTKDIVNWVYHPLIEGPNLWRKTIKNMNIEELLSRARSDSIKLVSDQKLHSRDLDLVFLQFSFLDRIGHVFTFKEKSIMTKSYFVAYDLLDQVYELVNPQYFIVTSDHGFWRSVTEHIFANYAVLILNNRAYRFFKHNQGIKNFSIKNLSKLLWIHDTRSRYYFYKSFIDLFLNQRFANMLQYFLHFNYVAQTDIFDIILRKFNVAYNKTDRRIPKKTQVVTDQDADKAIEERLKRLGYL
ncbi:MAG: alkaline phosphatase family protein [Candidatus Bathyarchaeota archaeon]|nr:MAG: alkaline phosphatase family protein [Candidatus Bathyarchaeota archaeon]